MRVVVRFSGWHWVLAEAAPGVAAENATQAEPRTADWAVCFYGLEKIVRTGRLVTAPGMWSEGDLEHRAEESLVKANQHANDRGDGPGDHGSWRWRSDRAQHAEATGGFQPIFFQFRVSGGDGIIAGDNNEVAE